MSETQAAVPEFRVIAFTFAWRMAAGTLYGISRASLVAIGLLALAGMYFSPPLLLRLIVFLALVPGLAAALLARAFTARVSRTGDRWCLARIGLFRRGERIELDQDAIVYPSLWQIPAPGLGLTVRLAAPRGERRIELQAEAPGQLLRQVFPKAWHAVGDPLPPSVAYAEARSAFGTHRWFRFVARFVVFPLVPAFVIFRLHQYIEHGGLLGQYHLHGLQPYLSTLAFHWILVLMYLVLWAAVLRALAEIVSAGVARFWPEKAMGARAWAERGAGFCYYAGVIGLMVLRANL